MATPASQPPSAAPSAGWSAYLLTGLLVVAAGLVFFGLYLALPANQHFGALLAIGGLALVFALVSYLLESLSREPTAQRSLAFGFMGMGFATLFLAVGLGNYYGVETELGMVAGLVVLLLLLVVTIALIAWRVRTVAAERPRESARAAWRAQETVPSAFSYAAANAPTVPTNVAPPTPVARGAPPPRSP